MAGRIDNRVRRTGAIAAALVLVATSACAADRDPLEGPWAGDCGADVYCEIQVRRSGTDYEIDYVLEERGAEVCRVHGTFSRTAGRLSGSLGDGSVEITRHETATDLGLAVSGHRGAPCGMSRNVNGLYRWFIDE